MSEKIEDKMKTLQLISEFFFLQNVLLVLLLFFFLAKMDPRAVSLKSAVKRVK